MEQVKIILNPKYKELSSFVTNIATIFPLEGKTIYKSRNEIKVFETGPFVINVKQYKVPSLFNRLIYTFFRVPKCIRAYKYAQEIMARGFYTPEPIAYVIYKQFGFIQRSYFISIQSPYSHMLYDFGEGELSGRENIIIDLARYTASLHEKEVYHKDYSPGNILYETTGNGTSFCLVDINRMEFGPVSLQKGCANFARLWGKKDMFLLLATEYAKSRNYDIEECIRLVLEYRASFWTKYNKKHGIYFD